jgi:hypothetical protein
MPSKGNPRIVIRLQAIWKKALQTYAAAKGLTLAALIRMILMDWIRERVASTQNRVAANLHHLDMLIRTLETQAYAFGMKHGPDVTRTATEAEKDIDTQKERLALYDVAMSIMKDALKLSESEEAAANSRARMEALRLANAANRTAQAILIGYDRRDIERLLAEVKQTNESLRREIAAISEGTGRS